MSNLIARNLPDLEPSMMKSLGKAGCIIELPELLEPPGPPAAPEDALPLLPLWDISFQPPPVAPILNSLGFLLVYWSSAR